MSDRAEEPDWPCLDVSVPEEEGSESLLAECKTGEQESRLSELAEREENVVVVVVNGSKGEGIDDDRSYYEELQLGEERRRADEEKNVSIGEDTVKESIESQANEELKENKEGERDQNEGKEMKRGTCEMQKALVREDEGKEKKENENNVTDSFNSNRPADTVEEVERDGQDDPSKANPTASPDITPESEPEPHVDHKSRNEEAVMEEGREMGQTPCPPPKVLSALARFQSQAPGQSVQTKSWTKSSAETGRPCSMLSIRENAQTNLPNDSNHPTGVNIHSEASEEEDPPLIKVSELKKRFES